jgi:hypothetical protein
MFFLFKKLYNTEMLFYLNKLYNLHKYWFTKVHMTFNDVYLGITD